MKEGFSFDDDMDEGIDLGMELCDDCSINQATVHLTHVECNESETFHLCEDCARRRGVPIPDSDAILRGIEALVSGNAPSPFGNAQVKVTVKQINGGNGSGVPSGTATEPVAVKEEDIKCPGCRMKLSEFRSHGRLGCVKCYDTFESHIEKIMRQVHGTGLHKGKMYGVSEPRGRGKDAKSGDIERLRRELSDAVSEQRFERAAVIRDAIRDLESVK